VKKVKQRLIRERFFPGRGEIIVDILSGFVTAANQNLWRILKG
jgi:hypothetical protein